MRAVDRDFATLDQELHAEHWLTGRSSELLRPRADRRLCVKRFKPEWAPADVRAWADTAERLAAWLGSLPALAGLLEAKAPLEVGRDYVLREFVSLGTALSDIARYPTGAPPQLAALRAALAPALATAPPRLAAAARDTLCGNCATVFWDSALARFVMAEPRLGLEEIRK